MCKRVRILLPCCLVGLFAMAQTPRLMQAEWFIGNDPGEGLGTAMQVADGQWDQALEQVVLTTSALSPGDRVMSVRVKGANGYWSNVFRTAVHVSAAIGARQVRISTGEYFFDNDPGQGNATPLLASDGNFNEALEYVLASNNALAYGAHRLFVRVRGADAGWSALFTQVVQVNAAIAARDIRVQQGEFFFDSNPGEGNGTPLLAFDGNWNEALERGIASAASPAVGDHLLYVRVRASDGQWSNEYKTVLHVSPTLPLRAVHVQAAEYFWTTDPGEGAGLPMLAFDGDFDSAVEQADILSNGATLGDNMLGVRVRGADGNWSAAFRSIVHVSGPLTLRDVHIQLGEYFYDSDPGEGNGTVLTAFNGAWDEALEQGVADAVAPSVGDHLLYVRVLGADGIWSNEYKTVLHVSAPLSARPIAVLTGEYFWDADPGAGSGLSLTAADGAFDDALEAAVHSDIPELAAGPHVLGVRMMGMDGGWSAAFRQVVNVNPVPVQAIPVALSAFLQGPLQSSTTMSDALRTAGVIPLSEPFTALGYTHVGSGGETIDASVLTSILVGKVVDWIFVELRKKDDPTSVVQTRCGLIKDNGSIVSTNGISNITFMVPAGDYFISVRHRNHLAVMTADPVAMSAAGISLDLRLQSTPCYGSEARTEAFGRAALWGGDVDGDGMVKYTGSANDRDLILYAIGGVVPTNTVSGTYAQEDVNMDGTVKYTGAANDRDRILLTIGGVIPTNVRHEQLP
jgi:hypothetical protein